MCERWWTQCDRTIVTRAGRHSGECGRRGKKRGPCARRADPPPTHPPSALSKRVDAAAADARPPASADGHADRVAAASAALASERENVASMRADASRLRKAADAAANDEAAAGAAIARAKAVAAAEEPRLLHELSLHAHVARLHVNVNAPEGRFQATFDGAKGLARLDIEAGGAALVEEVWKVIH